MTPIDSRVLAGILADFDHLLAIDPASIDRRRHTARFMAVDDAFRKRLVPLRTAAWVGDDSQAGLKSGQRALTRLEAAGAIVRVARWGERCRHLSLTEAGEAAARLLAVELQAAEGRADD